MEIDPAIEKAIQLKAAEHAILSDYLYRGLSDGLGSAVLAADIADIEAGEWPPYEPPRVAKLQDAELAVSRCWSQIWATTEVMDSVEDLATVEALGVLHDKRCDQFDSLLASLNRMRSHAAAAPKRRKGHEFTLADFKRRKR